MFLQNTLKFLQDFRKFILNCSRTEIYLCLDIYWVSFMRFAQFRGILIVLCKILINFVIPSFWGYCMYLVNQLSILDAVQNPKQIFECRKFCGNNNSSGTSAKKSDRKTFLHFLILTIPKWDVQIKHAKCMHACSPTFHKT